MKEYIKLSVMPIIQQLKNKQFVISLPRSIATLEGWNRGNVMQFFRDPISGNIAIKRISINKIKKVQL